MKVNGEMIKKKEKEFFILMTGIDMKVILEMVNLKEKEFIFIIMVVDMKENGKMV